jgi:CheY-like chemotaxis protein
MKPKYPLLLAEDDANDVFFLQRAFQQAKVENPLQVVRDGQEAIEYLSGSGRFADRRQFPLPYLLVLDLKMPRKTGMDVLEWLQGQPELRCLPVLVLTSSAHRIDIERAYELGANGFVVKPASLEKRVELAKLIGAFWLEVNESPAVCTEGLEVARQLRQGRSRLSASEARRPRIGGPLELQRSSFDRRSTDEPIASYPAKECLKFLVR